nr:NAD(P)-dependent oxidoreductase [Streptomyces sp. AcE210]
MLATMKQGAHLIDTARARIADRDAVDRALRSGLVAGGALADAGAHSYPTATGDS